MWNTVSAPAHHVTIQALQLFALIFFVQPASPTSTFFSSTFPCQSAPSRYDLVSDTPGLNVSTVSLASRETLVAELSEIQQGWPVPQSFAGASFSVVTCRPETVAFNVRCLGNHDDSNDTKPARKCINKLYT